MQQIFKLILHQTLTINLRLRFPCCVVFLGGVIQILIDPLRSPGIINYKYFLGHTPDWGWQIIIIKRGRKTHDDGVGRLSHTKLISSFFQTELVQCRKGGRKLLIFFNCSSIMVVTCTCRVLWAELKSVLYRSRGCYLIKLCF